MHALLHGVFHQVINNISIIMDIKLFSCEVFFLCSNHLSSSSSLSSVKQPCKDMFANYYLSTLIFAFHFSYISVISYLISQVAFVDYCRH